MPGSENFLDKPADELAEFLLRVARADVAPQAARERALQNVASAALGLSVLSGSAALGTRSTLLKGTSWLVAKWLAAGLTSGLLGIGAAQEIQQLASKPKPHAVRAQTLAAPSAPPARLAARAEPPSSELPAATDAPPAAAFPELAASAALPAPVLAGGSAAPAVAHEQKSTPRASSDSSGVASPLASSKSSLTRELTFLEQARSALSQHHPGGALQALDEYRSEFPRGSMQIEAAALRVEAVGQSGDHAHAAQLARAFLTSFPTSPLAARVRAFSEVFVDGAQKP